MTLYDYLKMSNYPDFDTYDDVYDAIITVCLSEDPEDDYDEFCAELCKLVEVESISSNGNPVCNWSNLIEKNIDVFREFANNNWPDEYNYEDKDDFIYEWLNELHYFMAGYGEDGRYCFYKQELIDKCRS